MNKKLIVFLLIILLTNISLCAEVWTCKNKKVTTIDYGGYLLINNKYRAFFIETCWDSEGGRDCKMFKNKAYTYTIIWIDDAYELIIQNKWDKIEHCWSI